MENLFENEKLNKALLKESQKILRKKVLQKYDTLHENFSDEDLGLETRDPIRFGYWCRNHMELLSNEIKFMRKYIKDFFGYDVVTDDTLVYQKELFTALDELKKSPYYGWAGTRFEESVNPSHSQVGLEELISDAISGNISIEDAIWEAYGMGRKGL